MEPEINQGAPAAGAAPDAPQQSSLSAQEQELLNQLPDFLVNNVGSEDVLKAAGFAPETSAAPTPETPAAPPAAEAAPAAPPAPAPAEQPAGPDPVQQWFEKQAAVNEATAKALAEVAAKLNPPPPPPQPKRVEDMTDEEAYVYLTEQTVARVVQEALKPFQAEREAAKTAQEAAAKEASFKQLSAGFVAAASAVVGDVVGPERLAKLTPEQKAAVEDEILSTQAANAELKDAQGRMVGMSAAQAAQVVKARWAQMAALFGAPAPVSGQRPDTMQRARVGQSSGIGAPGTAQATPTFSDKQGNQIQVPDRASILKNYGGSTDKILDGLADGFAKARQS